MNTPSNDTLGKLILKGSYEDFLIGLSFLKNHTKSEVYDILGLPDRTSIYGRDCKNFPKEDSGRLMDHKIHERLYVVVFSYGIEFSRHNPNVMNLYEIIEI